METSSSTSACARTPPSAFCSETPSTATHSSTFSTAPDAFRAYRSRQRRRRRRRSNGAEEKRKERPNNSPTSRPSPPLVPFPPSLPQNPSKPAPTPTSPSQPSSRPLYTSSIRLNRAWTRCRDSSRPGPRYLISLSFRDRFASFSAQPPHLAPSSLAVVLSQFLTAFPSRSLLTLSFAIPAHSTALAVSVVHPSHCFELWQPDSAGSRAQTRIDLKQEYLSISEGVQEEMVSLASSLRHLTHWLC